MSEPTLLEVGRITKPHGIRGDVLVYAVSNVESRWQVGQRFQSDDREFIVSKIAPHKDRFIVHFEGVDNRDAAERISGLTLFAEPIEDANQLFVHDLIGKKVVDQEGLVRGTVVSVVANPASDLLELDSGALVPLTFLVLNGTDIEINAPEGLFD